MTLDKFTASYMEAARVHPLLAFMQLRRKPLRGIAVVAWAV